jgi:SCP-2 sterol transfer family
VAEFLSDDWIAALDRAARAAPGLASLAPETPLVIEQRVRLGDREVVYSLSFDATGARVVAGPASSPDVVLVTDAATAWALQRGAINGQEAAVTGHLKLRGDVERLRAAGEALRAVDDVFSEVRAATTYADEDDPGASARR